MNLNDSWWKNKIFKDLKRIYTKKVADKLDLEPAAISKYEYAKIIKIL